MLDFLNQIPVTEESQRFESVNTLHGLLTIALADLERVLADPRYEIDMACWHEPVTGDEGLCQVCLAGSVMAKSYVLSPDENVHPIMFGPAAAQRFKALDCLRSGNIIEAYTFLHGYPADLPREARRLSRDWIDRLLPHCHPIDIAETRRLLADLYVMRDQLERAGI
jgi:hypothetical protein